MKSKTELHNVAKFALFATSYTPLFILIIIKQVYDNRDYLHFGGFNIDAFKCLFEKFTISVILATIIFFGTVGCILLFLNLKQKRGNKVTVTDITNRNSESVGYIATYIIPLVFQDFNSLYEIIAVLFIFVIMYSIYTNSNLLLINPVLNLFQYSIFEIKYTYKLTTKSGLIIIRSSEIEEESSLNISPIGFKLYYASKNP